MNQITKKGAVVILLIILFLFLGLLFKHFLFITVNPNKSSTILPSPSVTAIPSSEEAGYPSPTINPTTLAYPLSAISDANMVRYSTANRDISFLYPEYFMITNNDIVSRYKEYPANLAVPYIWTTFSVPEAYIQWFDESKHQSCPNFMAFEVYAYRNTENLSLYNFILQKMESFDDTKNGTYTQDYFIKNLTSRKIAGNQSYEFAGGNGENSFKADYFTYKDSVYKLTLSGACQTGVDYTPDDERVFNLVLGSINFN